MCVNSAAMPVRASISSSSAPRSSSGSRRFVRVRSRRSVGAQAKGRGRPDARDRATRPWARRRPSRSGPPLGAWRPHAGRRRRARAPRRPIPCPMRRIGAEVGRQWGAWRPTRSPAGGGHAGRTSGRCSGRRPRAYASPPAIGPRSRACTSAGPPTGRAAGRAGATRSAQTPAEHARAPRAGRASGCRASAGTPPPPRARLPPVSW